MRAIMTPTHVWLFRNYSTFVFTTIITIILLNYIICIMNMILIVPTSNYVTATTFAYYGILMHWSKLLYIDWISCDLSSAPPQTKNPQYTCESKLPLLLHHPPPSPGHSIKSHPNIPVNKNHLHRINPPLWSGWCAMWVCRSWDNWMTDQTTCPPSNHPPPPPLLSPVHPTTPSQLIGKSNPNGLDKKNENNWHNDGDWRANGQWWCRWWWSHTVLVRCLCCCGCGRSRVVTWGQTWTRWASSIPNWNWRRRRTAWSVAPTSLSCGSTWTLVMRCSLDTHV